MNLILFSVGYSSENNLILGTKNTRDHTLLLLLLLVSFGFYYPLIQSLNKKPVIILAKHLLK